MPLPIATSATQPKNNWIRTSFSRDFRKFFKSVMRQRQHLINIGKSKKDPKRIDNTMAKFRPRIDINYNDIGAARFLTRNHSGLMLLIPSHAKARFAKLEELMVQADQIMNPEIF